MDSMTRGSETLGSGTLGSGTRASGPLGPGTRASAFVGRVGALAVALGVGVAVATGGTAVAWADSGSTASSSSSQDSSSKSNPAQTRSSAKSGIGSGAGSGPGSRLDRPASRAPLGGSGADSSATEQTGARERTGSVFGSGRTGAVSSGTSAGRSAGMPAGTSLTGRLADSVRDAVKPWRPATTRSTDPTPVETPAEANPEAQPDAHAGSPGESTAPETQPAPSSRGIRSMTAVLPDTESTNTESTNTESTVQHDDSERRSSLRSTAASVPELSTPVRLADATAVRALAERLTERRSVTLESVRAFTDVAATAALTSAASVAAATVEPVALITAAPEATPAVDAEQPAAPRLVTGLLAAVGLAPFTANSPLAPAQSTPLLALLGWARRETDRAYTQQARSLVTARPAVVSTAAVVDPLPADLIGKTERIGPITGPGITDGPNRLNIYGTDLGIMWDMGEWRGQRAVHVVFGDTFSGPNMSGDWISNAIMISTSRTLYENPAGFLEQTGPALQFIPGGQLLSWFFPAEVTVIPTAGVHANGTQYVNYMSVRQWGVPGSWTTNFSAISRYDQATDTWVTVPSSVRSAGWLRSSTPYRAGDQNFQQMAYVLQPVDQVGEDGVRYVYAFGTPSGRQGSVHLSRVPEEHITDVSKYEYWDGNAWVSSAAHAAPIIGESTRSAGLFGFIIDWANDPNVFGGYLGGLFGAKTGGNVGEMSVQYNEYLGKYVILYGNGRTNNIEMRIADSPEGPWSDPIILATPQQYPGLYAPMIHPWSGTGYLLDENGDPDPESLYWNMSMWGPYNVYLMQTDLSSLVEV